jgi:predicted secreted protein
MYLRECAAEDVRARSSPRERKPPMKPPKMRERLGSGLWLLLFVLLVLVLLPELAFAASRVITDGDKGASVQLKTGDILEVHLRSNPTTGYMWYVHPKSTPLLKLIGQSQTQAAQPGVGRPIFQIFQFQAVGAGDGVLLLHYIRTWEKPLPAEEQFDLHVAIR